MVRKVYMFIVTHKQTITDRTV